MVRRVLDSRNSADLYPLVSAVYSCRARGVGEVVVERWTVESERMGLMRFALFRLTVDPANPPTHRRIHTTHHSSVGQITTTINFYLQDHLPKSRLTRHGTLERGSDQGALNTPMQHPPPRAYRP